MVLNALVLLLVVLVEGIAKYDHQTLLVSRSLLGTWRIEEPTRIAGRYCLISALAPWRVYAAIPLDGTTPSGESIGMAGHRTALSVLQMLAIAVWLLLVVVVPWTFEHNGALGLLLTATCLFVVAAETALGLYLTSRTQRVSLPVGRVLGMLWPFSAIRAGDEYAQSVLASVDATTFLWHEIPVDFLSSYFREEVYDRVRGRAPQPGANALRSALVERWSGEQLEQIYAEMNRNDGASSTWCPRCGSEFREEMRRCSDCDVELTVGAN